MSTSEKHSPNNQDIAKALTKFVTHVQTNLKGYEKGEAQLYCERLFQAFGHPGLSEVGAELEFQVRTRRGQGTKFADLLWRPRVLIEMKSRGQRLEKHYLQAFEYWRYLVPDRPKYVVLCNFDEFWIYDFNTQLDSPVDRVPLEQLPDRYTAFGFLLPEEQKPLFNNDKVAVTRGAADKVAAVFNALIENGEDRDAAQYFILQCVVALFAEDFDLMPKDFFSYLLADCQEGGSAYDLIGGLFRQMADSKPARGGRYQGVGYFNGGLFDHVEPMDLRNDEVSLLQEAASENWRSVAPPIFGTLFQNSMDADRRHELGAHFTHEADILKIVMPTISEPWRERIDATNSLQDLQALSADLQSFRVLDPACGSGNFLYIAYREVVRLHMEILSKVIDSFSGREAIRFAQTQALHLPPTTNFYGIDTDPFAAELAKVTLMLAKRIAVAETKDNPFAEQQGLGLEFEEPLPLDNLDENIRSEDALFCDWPTVDTIIGNPPFQSKNKMQQEFGPAYVNRVRDAFPDVPGRADFCTYWFRKAHDHLTEGQRAGLVGTNTIKQNYSRQGSLEYICDNGGTIIEAVSSQVWSGDADVHVSLVNWVKGNAVGKKKLSKQIGDRLDSPWQLDEVEVISPTLSPNFDVSTAAMLKVNSTPKTAYQGQTHGHPGFLLTINERNYFVEASAQNEDVLFPYLTANDLLSTTPPRPRRYMIDFSGNDILTAQRYSALFRQLEETVLPDRQNAAEEEARRNQEALEEYPNAQVNWHHRNFFESWWQPSYGREELMQKVRASHRYIACGQVTKRPIFVFVSSQVNPNAALQVFTFSDDYSFGILQSSIHWEWFIERCSTLTERYRYTSNTVYNSFPWPQNPTKRQVIAVSEAARSLRALRRRNIIKNDLSLRNLYRTMEIPGTNPLKDAHMALDAAVIAAYGFNSRKSILPQLFQLNQELAAGGGAVVQGPGLPSKFQDLPEVHSTDAIPWD